MTEISAEQLETEQSMFVQTAQGIESDGAKLTLQGITPSTLYFSDRPQRVVGHMATSGFRRPVGRRRQQLRDRPAERGALVPRARRRRPRRRGRRAHGAEPDRRRRSLLLHRGARGSGPGAHGTRHAVHRPVRTAAIARLRVRYSSARATTGSARDLTTNGAGPERPPCPEPPHRPREGAGTHRPPAAKGADQMKSSPRANLIAVVALLALIAAGCGSSGGSSTSTSTTTSASATETWATGVCTSITTWQAALKSAAGSLKSNPTKNGLQTAGDDAKAATETLASDLKGLGKPDTQAGTTGKDLARSARDQLAAERRDDRKRRQRSLGTGRGTQGRPNGDSHARNDGNTGQDDGHEPRRVRREGGTEDRVRELQRLQILEERLMNRASFRPHCAQRDEQPGHSTPATGSPS